MTAQDPKLISSPKQISFEISTHKANRWQFQWTFTLSGCSGGNIWGESGLALAAAVEKFSHTNLRILGKFHHSFYNCS